MARRTIEIQKSAVISTAHLTPATREEWAATTEGCADNLRYGFRLWMPSAQDGLPDDAWAACKFIRKHWQGHDITHIIFDRDGDVVDGLPTYEDS